MWVGNLYFPDPEATVQYGILFFALMGIAILVTRKD